MISRAQYTQFCSYLHILDNARYLLLECVWNVMVDEQKPDFVFRRNGRVHLNLRGRQFSRLLAAEVCGISGSNAGYIMFRGSVKGTGYPLHSQVSPSLALPCVTVSHHISTGVHTYTFAYVMVDCVSMAILIESVAACEMMWWWQRLQNTQTGDTIAASQLFVWVEWSPRR